MARRLHEALLASFLLSLSASAAPAKGHARAPAAGKGPSTAAPALDPPLLSRRGPESIGSISVGHPHQGFLFNPVRMPDGPEWSISVPDHAYGTEETVASLVHCIRRVRALFPTGTPPVFIGSISAAGGGLVPPHKSHQSGRDADVYLIYKPGTTRWYEPAGPHNLDRARTWALMRAFITEADVDFILLDRAPQALLEEYALSIGEDPAWIDDLFHGTGRYPNPLVKHVPGHTAHMHVRFVSPESRERGRLAYDGLVELGHIDLESRGIEHTVARGDTLLGLAAEFATTVERIKELNRLDSDTIRVGQKLQIFERKDLRSAKDPVIVPPRRLPGRDKSRRSEDTALYAALAELETKAGSFDQLAALAASSSRAKRTGPGAPRTTARGARRPPAKKTR